MEKKCIVLYTKKKEEAIKQLSSTCVNWTLEIEDERKFRENHPNYFNMPIEIREN